MSDETSESSNFSNFSMNVTTGGTPEPILSLVNSLLNNQNPATNNFIINTPDLIQYGSSGLQSTQENNPVPNTPPDESTHAESEANPPDTSALPPEWPSPGSMQINGRRYVIPSSSNHPHTPIPPLGSNPLIDFLNFVENDILTPPPPPPQTSEEAVTGNPRQGLLERLTSAGAIGPMSGIDESEEEELDEEPPVFQMRRNSIVRAINRTRNRRRGMFFQQFMNHLMDNADDQILQQVMHESFVEDQEKRLIDQARELDIQMVKYDPTNKDFDKCTSCRICFSDYKKGEEVGILPCKHFFHYSCIQEWGKRRPVCPFCDIDIPTVNEQAAKKQKTS